GDLPDILKAATVDAALILKDHFTHGIVAQALKQRGDFLVFKRLFVGIILFLQAALQLANGFAARLFFLNHEGVAHVFLKFAFNLTIKAAVIGVRRQSPLGLAN